MSRSRKSSVCIDPERNIPAFSLPWIHRDNWNDKEWFYSIEGVWYLKASENMEEVLRSCGAGPNATSMVLSADMVISLQEDVSYHWWIRCEYRFKALNHLGFKTSTHKMTSNKFFPDAEKPESLEDWDKRFLVTTCSTMTRLQDSSNIEDITLVLNQVAEKDVRFKNDSKVEFFVEDDELYMVTSIKTQNGIVSGTRKFCQYNLDKLGDASLLKGSGMFGISPNVSRRGSFMTSRRASKELSGDLLMPFPGESNRRSSYSKVPEHLLPKMPVIEISEH